MLTCLRDVRVWHGQRTVELIFLSPAWVCSTARGSPFSLPRPSPSPCLSAELRTAATYREFQHHPFAAPSRSRGGAGAAPSPVVGSARREPWQPHCLLAVPAGMAGSLAESLANAPWSEKTAGAAAGGLWAGPDPRRGLAPCLLLGEDGERELGRKQPHFCSFAAVEDLALVTGRNTKHS